MAFTVAPLHRKGFAIHVWLYFRGAQRDTLAGESILSLLIVGNKIGEAKLTRPRFMDTLVYPGRASPSGAEGGAITVYYHLRHM